MAGSLKKGGRGGVTVEERKNSEKVASAESKNESNSPKEGGTIAGSEGKMKHGCI